jgi:HEAT repeat protein
MKPETRDLLVGSEDEKETAAESLMAMGTPAVPDLQLVYDQGDKDARWWAVRALAGIPGEAASKTLVAALSDPDEDVQACVVMAIGERGETNPVILTQLVGLLRIANPYLGRQISDALSKIGEAAVPDLLIALEDQSPAVRSHAARALVRIESHHAIPALIKALDDPEAVVEHYAWEALVRMGVGVTCLIKP